MSFTWHYPLYLIPLDGGYVSVVGAQPEVSPVHHLAVFTSEDLAMSFMQHCAILGAPRPLRNAREFGWLLQSLRHPVTQVTFDPQPDSAHVASRWTATVEDLLQHHLVPDNSPWNYPVFVVRQQRGYASILGQSPDGMRWTAVGLFTLRGKAEAYLQASHAEGTICELGEVAEVRALLREMAATATAVALDPTISEGRHSAAHCFSIQTLLDRYLTASS